LLFTG